MDTISHIKVVVVNVVGSLFSPIAFYSPRDGEVLRKRTHVDGQAIVFLNAIGIRVVFISAGDETFIGALVERLNHLPTVQNIGGLPFFPNVTGEQKVKTLEVFFGKEGFSWNECAYLGNDFSDYAAFTKAGFRATPADAEAPFKKMAHFVAERNAGEGALRDLANHIIEKRGVDLSTLPLT